MSSLRICASLPFRRLVLGPRCCMTLVDQLHIRALHISSQLDELEVQDSQTLQEKRIAYFQGKDVLTAQEPQIDFFTNAKAKPELSPNLSSGNIKHVGQKHHASELSSASREELMAAALQDVNVELPSNVYKELIPKLCDNGDVDRALFWHRKLVSKGDAPRNVQDIEKLRQMLIERRDWTAALEVKKSIVAQDIDNGPLSSLSTQDLVDHKKALQSLVSKLDKRVGVVPFHPYMDDHTCARFLATTFFSIEFILEGMALFGVTKLGSLSIQEIIKRTIRGHHCDSEVAQQYFTRMHKLGIECGTRYGRMLEHLTVHGKDILLHSFVTSDLDPDMYEDIRLQESLLHNQDKTIIERTRVGLSFEMGEREVEIRNILLCAGFDSIELMLADGVPITFETRALLLESVYIDRMPWISETRLRMLTRVFLRLPHVTSPEWREIVVCFMYIIRPHLRRDLEALLLSIRLPEVFDTRLVSDIIRWYLRLGSLGRRHSIETMLGGIRVLVALRNQGVALNIQASCEANLMSLFGDTPIPEMIDTRKRVIARSLGTMEDFITVIKDIWGPGLWPGLSLPEIKAKIFTRAEELSLRRQPTPGVFLPSKSHSGSYNPGKIKHLQKQATKMIEDVDETSPG